ncbi:hypothetical protein KAJ83_13420 [Marivibrio halodurans]|uniref:Uncharacterized protein n=1 Tax=Marivibrio halodurans TaxID=2039722 RepID=A0A8J7V3J5_9PROT|nr:hypothetical protein [Marivibrio halodurans]MBP5858012.1 hypothetical protein [Marivibrio halodurans]
MFPRPARLLMPLCALLALAGCYLPDNFRADLQVAADGRYAFVYEGDLTQLQFLQRIGTGELDGERLAEYVGIYERDLKRDSGFKKIEYLGNARYHVRYEQSGDLTETRQFSFPRRNAKFLGLRVREDGLIEIFGDKLPEQHREELLARGFDARGIVRVWARGEVLTHNAESVTQGSPPLYQWTIRSLRDPTPNLILAPAR